MRRVIGMDIRRTFGEVGTWAPPSTRWCERFSAGVAGFDVLGASGAPILLFSCGFPDHRAHLSRRYPSFVEDQAVHVVGEVGERDLGLGALDADGADEQPHLVLLPGEHMFDTGTDLGFRGVGVGGNMFLYRV